MRLRYRILLGQLADLSVQNKDEKLTSMELGKSLFCVDKERFKGTVGLLNVVARASIFQSIESPLESAISVMEHHSNKRKPVKQERLDDKLQVA